LLSQPVITAPIVGANSVAQLSESLAACEARLTAEEMAMLSEASASEG
jgi:aryl-alcohol dehydrogenase-like predicted oxidoreductase